jgi:hypothetical protein
MDDLDRLLAETLRDAAERAPADDGLLATVHRRSDRRHRGRVALSAVAAALAIVAVSLARIPESEPAPSNETVVQLVDGWTAPAFPYTLPASAGLTAPVASMSDGDLVGFFEATEQRHHADTTVTVSSTKPSLSGPAAETPVLVRGHVGTLRTVDVRPAKQLTLFWRESAARWITLATDDTYGKQQVVGLADALSEGAVPVLPPFHLDLSPAGFVTDTVTESTMTFRTTAGAPDTDELKVVLRKRRPLTTANQTVGPYQASLTRDASGITLDIDVTDWQATLEVTAGPGLTLDDAGLLRFAAGIHILNRSNPQ